MKKLTQVGPYFVILLFAVIARLLPHDPNFTPIAALALFGGKITKGKWGFVLPLLAMLCSDYLLLYINPYRSPVIDFSSFYSPLALLHSTTLFVYASFLGIALIGRLLQRKGGIGYLMAASVLGSVLFFLVTNFGSWIATELYPHTITGLFAAYAAGIPFLRGTMLGDLFYTTLIFGGLALFGLIRSQRLSRQQRVNTDLNIQA